MNVADLTLFDAPQHFDGPAYEPQHDQERLSSQFQRIFDVMRDGQWRTLDEIARLAAAPAASVSAQLRHARKPRFGSHTVHRRPSGDRASGLFEYQLIVRLQIAGPR